MGHQSMILMLFAAVLSPGTVTAATVLTVDGEPVTAVTILSVDDGDSITVSERGNSFTIDLACIDAPEMEQGPFGTVALQRLQALAPIGSEVDLRYVVFDKNDRLVGEVFSKGHNVNLAMVRSGIAFAYDGRQEDNRILCGGLGNRRPLDFLEVELYAGADRLGVWAVPGGIKRPWDWRLENRTATPSGDRCQVKRWLFPGALRDPCMPDASALAESPTLQQPSPTLVSASPSPTIAPHPSMSQPMAESPLRSLTKQPSTQVRQVLDPRRFQASLDELFRDGVLSPGEVRVRGLVRHDGGSSSSSTPAPSAIRKPLSTSEQALLDKIRSSPSSTWRQYGSCIYDWGSWKLIANGVRTTAVDCGGTAMRWIVGVHCGKLQVNTFRFDGGWLNWEKPAGPNSKFRAGEDEMVAALCANAHSTQTPSQP